MKNLNIMAAGFCLAAAIVHAMSGGYLMALVMIGLARFNLEMGTDNEQ